MNRSDQARLRIVRNHALRLFMIAAASVIMALNIKSFVNAGGLFPGGFTGLTLLIQRGAEQFWELTLPFSLINFLLNTLPAVISFRLIGKRFTLYSCLMIVLTSLLTDILPALPITDDVLLICIFGGIINGFAISLCLLGGATSGGTDFIAVAVSEKRGVDAWNYILFGNAAMLVVAGFLFGWDKALYSILFQYASTQIVHLLNPRYKRTTLFIISDKSDEIARAVRHISEDVAAGKLDPTSVTEETISNYLDTAGIPDPDLLIRTSGELRLSNFLLWQLAYSEFYFTDVPWPDFHKEELERAIEAYNKRDRRFGGLTDNK